MTNKESNWNKIISRIVTIIGIVIFITSIVLILKLFFDSCDKNACEITLGKSYLLLGILLSGIIMMTSEVVLGNIIKQKLKDEFIKDKNELAQILQDSIINDTEQAIDELNEEKEINTMTSDTLIIPAGKTYDLIQKYNIYAFPIHRRFKETKYVGIYYNQSIRQVSEYEIVDDITEIEAKNAFIDRLGNVQLKYFKLKINTLIKLNVINPRSSAYVQNRRYVKYDKLITAKTTDDLIS